MPYSSAASWRAKGSVVTSVLGLQMRATLASLLEESGLRAEDSLRGPQTGPWSSELSRAGIVACARPDCDECPRRQDICSHPGCIARKSRTLLIVRGITQ